MKHVVCKCIEGEKYPKKQCCGLGRTKPAALQAGSIPAASQSALGTWSGLLLGDERAQGYKPPLCLIIHVKV